jgi:glutathione S-transferase
MKLYGHFISLTTLQVLFLVAEKRASPELVLVDVFAKDQKSPAHRELHPFGHIPVLLDGELRVYETHAILRYLHDRLPGPTFKPSDLAARAMMDQWLCIEQNYLLPAAKKVMSRGYAEMMNLPDPGPAAVEQGQDELSHCQEQFARWIDGRPFIAGDAPSLADLCWAAALHERASKRPAGILSDPRVVPWCERMKSRPSWQAALDERQRYAPQGSPSATIARAH